MDFSGMDEKPLSAEAAAAPVYHDPNKPIAPVKRPTSYYELMLSLSDLGAKEKNIKNQMALAEEMRTTGAPAMRGNSRIMVKAHPLEFINAGMRQVMGARQRQQGMEAQDELANEIRRRIIAERSGGGGSFDTTPMPYSPQMGE